MPHADFSHCPDDDDAIWRELLARYGPAEEHTSHRESAELHRIADRARPNPCPSPCPNPNPSVELLRLGMENRVSHEK